MNLRRRRVVQRSRNSAQKSVTTTEEKPTEMDGGLMEEILSFGEVGGSASDSLKKQGIFYLCGEVNERTCKQLSEELLALHFDEAWSDPVILLINSEGGSVPDASSLISTMGFVRMNICTPALSMSCSAGLEIAMAGTKGKRYVAPGTELLAHRFSWGMGGSHAALVAAGRRVQMLHNQQIKHYVRHSKYKTAAQVEKHLLKEHDVWLTPEEALEHGLFDFIGMLGHDDVQES